MSQIFHARVLVRRCRRRHVAGALFHRCRQKHERDGQQIGPIEKRSRKGCRHGIRREFVCVHMGTPRVDDKHEAGNPTLKPQYASAYADYIVKFFDAYQDEGVTFWGMTAQNEPAGNTGKWQDLKFTAATQRFYQKQSWACFSRKQARKHRVDVLR